MAFHSCAGYFFIRAPLATSCSSIQSIQCFLLLIMRNHVPLAAAVILYFCEGGAVAMLLCSAEQAGI